MTDELAIAVLYADHNRRLRRSQLAYQHEPLAASKISVHCAISNALLRGRISDNEAAEMRAEVNRW